MCESSSCRGWGFFFDLGKKARGKCANSMGCETLCVFHRLYMMVCIMIWGGVKRGSIPVVFPWLVG